MRSSVISILAIAAAVSAKTVSTVYETEHYTITSCEPTVTDCVAHETSTIHTYTTECDDDEVYPTPTPEPTLSYEHDYTTVEEEYTTSTVYETKEYTVTSCAPTVTDCPYGSVTKTVIASTTVCPVTHETHYPTSVHEPEYTPAPYPTPVDEPTFTTTYVHETTTPVLSTKTISTCVPTVIYEVITVTASPSTHAEYTHTSVEHPVYGTAAPSAGYTHAPSNGTLPFTGAATAQKASGLFLALGVVAALL